VSKFPLYASCPSSFLHTHYAEHFVGHYLSHSNVTAQSNLHLCTMRFSSQSPSKSVFSNVQKVASISIPGGAALIAPSEK